MPTTLFVYGSLKQSGAAHGLLAGARLLGPARTRPRYRLWDLGAYPGLTGPADGGTAVRGELWWVDDDLLARLDDYEGEEYERRPVELDSGLAAQAYFFLGRLPARDCGETWP